MHIFLAQGMPNPEVPSPSESMIRAGTLDILEDRSHSIAIYVKGLCEQNPYRFPVIQTNIGFSEDPEAHPRCISTAW